MFIIASITIIFKYSYKNIAISILLTLFEFSLLFIISTIIAVITLLLLVRIIAITTVATSTTILLVSLLFSARQALTGRPTVVRAAWPLKGVEVLHVGFPK